MDKNLSRILFSANLYLNHSIIPNDKFLMKVYAVIQNECLIRSNPQSDPDKAYDDQLESKIVSPIT